MLIAIVLMGLRHRPSASQAMTVALQPSSNGHPKHIDGTTNLHPGCIERTTKVHPTALTIGDNDCPLMTVSEGDDCARGSGGGGNVRRSMQARRPPSSCPFSFYALSREETVSIVYPCR